MDSPHPFDERARLGRRLLIVGFVGAVASLTVGVAGWFLAGRTATTVTRSIGPVAAIVDDLADAIEAIQTLFDRTTEAIESVENAARSSVRTIDSVSTVIDDTSELAGGEVADSLEAAVDTLPGLISTSRVIDNTMRALSFVGVDYDPEVPLDESLIELEASLAPLPDQIRDQADAVGQISADLDRIAEEGRELSGILLETRIDMLDTERVLRSANANARAAAATVGEIESEVGTYDTLAHIAVVAAALALLACSLAPLLIGASLVRNPTERQPSSPTP